MTWHFGITACSENRLERNPGTYATSNSLTWRASYRTVHHRRTLPKTLLSIATSCRRCVFIGEMSWLRIAYFGRLHGGCTALKATVSLLLSIAYVGRSDVVFLYSTPRTHSSQNTLIRSDIATSCRQFVFIGDVRSLRIRVFLRGLHWWCTALKATFMFRCLTWSSIRRSMWVDGASTCSRCTRIIPNYEVTWPSYIAWWTDGPLPSMVQYAWVRFPAWALLFSTLKLYYSGPYSFLRLIVDDVEFVFSPEEKKRVLVRSCCCLQLHGV